MVDAKHKEERPVLIRQAASPANIQAVIACFNAYMSWLDEDVSFQDYDDEKKILPGAYSPPTGALLLAVDAETDQTLGCIAFRPLRLHAPYADSLGAGRTGCEMKRLFVFPEARGRRVSRLLIGEALTRARDGGYDDIVLDTLPKMTTALALYKSEGFEEMARYYYSPLPGTVYLRKRLR